MRKLLSIKTIIIVPIVVILFSMIVSSVFAWDDCRKGLHCESPGQCHDYVDTNNNNICDHGETQPSDSTGESSEENITDNNNNTNNNSAETNNSFTETDNSTNRKAASAESIFTPMLLSIVLLLIISIIVIKKSMPGYIRIILLIISLLYLGFYLGGCICPIGAFQNLPLCFAGLLSGQYYYWILLVIIPIIAAFILGRIYCGSVCPIGAVQELLFRIGKKIGLNNGNPGLLGASWLKYFKYVFMSGLIVFTAVIGTNLFCSIDPFKVLFNFTGSAVAIVLLIIVLIASLFISRPWCRIVCPYGALLGITSKIAKAFNKRITPTIDTSGCKKCGLCTNNCPMNAIENGAVDEAECINCGECKKQCKFKTIK